jgi:predicted RNA-binding Zn-ribbon protein involved in translation (DUF1610 family)
MKLNPFRVDELRLLPTRKMRQQVKRQNRQIMVGFFVVASVLLVVIAGVAFLLTSPVKSTYETIVDAIMIALLVCCLIWGAIYHGPYAYRRKVRADIRKLGIPICVRCGYRAASMHTETCSECGKAVELMSRENREQVKAKPVITRWLLFFSYLGFICSVPLILILVYMGLALALVALTEDNYLLPSPDGVMGIYLFPLLVVLTLVAMSSRMTVHIIARRPHTWASSSKTKSYRLAFEFTSRHLGDLALDPLFKCSLISIPVIVFFVFAGKVGVAVIIAIAVFLIFNIVNIWRRKPAAWLCFISGFSELQATKLAKLLEENDGRVCLSCRHVLISKDEADPKCPECGAVDDRWLYQTSLYPTSL